MGDQSSGMPPLSDDGRWWWDGQRWQSLFSADGSRRWDGSQWQPVPPDQIRPGKLPPASAPGGAAAAPFAQAVTAASPLPQAPVAPAPPAPAAPPALELVPVRPVGAVAADRPDWLAEDVAVPQHHYMAAPAGAMQSQQPAPWQPGPAPHWQQMPRPRRNLMPMMFGLAMIAMVGVAFLALGGWRYIPGTGARGADLHNEAALLLAFQKDDVYTYKFKETIDGITQVSGQPNETFRGDVAGTLTLKVLSLDDKGVATVELKQQVESGSVNGQNLPRQEAQVEKVQIGTDGRLTGGNLGAGSDPTGGVPGTDQIMAILPDGKVKPGDTWTKDFNRPNLVGSGNIRYHSSSTLARYETINGIEAAVVQSDASAPLDIVFDLTKLASGQPSPYPAGSTLVYKGKVTSNSTSWVDPRARNLLRTKEKGDFDFSYTFYGVRTIPSIPFYFTGRYSTELESAAK